MASKYDHESLATDIENLLLDNLSTKITALNTEKGDDLLETIPREAYHFQSLDFSEVVDRVALLYGLFEPQADSAQGTTAEEVSIEIYVIMARQSNNESDKIQAKRAFRYRRALREVIEDNFDELINGSNMEVSNLDLVPLTFEDSDDTALAIGISISVHLA